MQPDDPYRRYLEDFGAGSTLEPTKLAIAGAVARAVKDYAASEGADASTAAALTEAGIGRALNYLDGLDAQVQRGSLSL